ncbi:hypothetical protein OG455_41325 [Kitasatospora sp. NBC_01287]|uniref:hypothetical protein n=1 Tax=Kitasatospora sp. NBC_01287 TaxID=2903573 RepID=UPI00224DDC7C|nr:hypothetical protein [Kitasatospora sp. NBC_01287]MCX4750925.1 hypothetical protein [Kitasatospora sp. NBC_01287]MCX4751824.1 hypothetical protein [Kitasatospora sp. NBC_01287]MCX4751884.1 hypothetical protein [Kitasatospora sp. NBC_01287]
MRALFAFLLLSIAWPALGTAAITASTWLAANLTLDLTAAALILLARHRPHRAHPIITFLAGAAIATWITGHRPKPTPLTTATGPQIPA